ncbi:hypothetical protein [Halorientalis salina]|uniref:hypothetical protein n=1 Tax=Halorientalis salina TaxID=2932266 RepID=UPI0010AD2700|nr:hypothetical protein [Halorientalis salina]
MGDPTEMPDRAAPESARRRLLLSFVAFLFLFGQPVVVFALTVLSAPLPSLAVVVAGTGLLAAPTASAFVRADRSVGRLADFVLAVAGVQIVLILLAHVALSDAGSMATVARPAIVFVSYPVAYYLVYHSGAAKALNDRSRG